MKFGDIFLDLDQHTIAFDFFLQSFNVKASVQDAAQVSIREVKTSEGAHCLQLKVSPRSRLRDGFWNFLERYGFRYGDNISRPLLPCEVGNFSPLSIWCVIIF